MTQEDYRATGKMMTERDSMTHVHLLMTMTDVAHDHQHVVVGTTGPARQSRKSHVHSIHIRTSFDPKNGKSHWHIADTVTGPAIEVPGGDHTHFFRGDTTYDSGHKHCFSSVTDTTTDNDHCDEEYEEEEKNCNCNYRNCK